MIATETQNRFGKLLDTAQREPVTIDELRLWESVEDVLAGRTIPAETVFAELKEKIQSGKSKMIFGIEFAERARSSASDTLQWISAQAAAVG